MPEIYSLGDLQRRGKQLVFEGPDAPADRERAASAQIELYRTLSDEHTGVIDKDLPGWDTLGVWIGPAEKGLVRYGDMEARARAKKTGSTFTSPVISFALAETGDITLAGELRRNVEHVYGKYLDDIEGEVKAERYAVRNVELLRLKKRKSRAKVRVDVDYEEIDTFPSLGDYWLANIAPVLRDYRTPAEVGKTLFEFIHTANGFAARYMNRGPDWYYLHSTDAVRHVSNMLRMVVYTGRETGPAFVPMSAVCGGPEGISMEEPHSLLFISNFEEMLRSEGAKFAEIARKGLHSREDMPAVFGAPIDRVESYKLVSKITSL